MRPPNEVADRIDWVSEAWLASEAKVLDGVGLGITGVMEGSAAGDGGNGFSEDSDTGRDGIYMVFRTSLLPRTVPAFRDGIPIWVSVFATLERAAFLAS